MKKAVGTVTILLITTLVLLWLVKSSGKTTVDENDQPHVAFGFLDVGQGDATFIEWPDGTQMLIDCGKDARVLEALGRVMSFYDRELEYLVVTHPDLDHFGGCTDVMKRLSVSNVVYTGVDKQQAAWQAFWQTVVEQKTKVHLIQAHQVWQMGSSTLTFLYPNHDRSYDTHVPGFDKADGDNNASIVMRLSFGEMDVLLPGDAEQELEQYLVETYAGQLDSEVLKVSHHGSGGSSITPFLEAVTPIHSIISAGKNNPYGHPSRRVLKRLERSSSTIWRTDINGDVMMYVYPDMVVVR